jgi:hypothetical protein
MDDTRPIKRQRLEEEKEGAGESFFLSSWAWCARALRDWHPAGLRRERERLTAGLQMTIAMGPSQLPRSGD